MKPHYLKNTKENKVPFILKAIVLLSVVSSASFINAQSATIGSCGTLGSPNAVLDLNSASNRNKGIIIPHVSLSATLTQFSPPMSVPATIEDTGMMVYNTNASLPGGAGYYCWNGSIWVYVGGGRSIVAPNLSVVYNNVGTATGSSSFTWEKITSGTLSGDTAITGTNGFLDFNNYDYNGLHDPGITLGNSGGVLSLQQDAGGNLMFQSFGNGDLFEMGDGINYTNSLNDNLAINNEFQYKNPKNEDLLQIDQGMNFQDGEGNWIQTDTYAGGGIELWGQDWSALEVDGGWCGRGFWFGLSDGTQFDIQDGLSFSGDPEGDNLYVGGGEFDFSDNSHDQMMVGGYGEGGVQLTGQDGSHINIDAGSAEGIGFSSPTGIQMPTLTTSEINAISSPPAGTIVWNSTTNRFNIYNGSSWQYISGTDGNYTISYYLLVQYC